MNEDSRNMLGARAAIKSDKANVNAMVIKRFLVIFKTFQASNRYLPCGESR